MSLTSKFVTKSGIVTVTLATSVYTGTDTFEIYDIGTIDYDFDVTSYGSVVENLGAMYSRSKLVVSYYTKGNLNVFDLLYDEITIAGLPSNSVIPVTLAIEAHNGSSYEFKYEIRSTGLKYDENSLKVNLELDPQTITSTVKSIYDDRVAILNTPIGVGAGDNPAIMAGSFIQDTVSGMNTNLPTIYEPATTTSGYSGIVYALPIGINPPEGKQLYVRDEASNVTTPAIADVARYAVLAGDIYGTGFDSNFYVHRLLTNRVVQVDYDQIESLQYSFTNSPYRNIILDLNGTLGTNVVAFSQTLQGNAFADKSISGVYVLPSYVYKAFFDTIFVDYSETDYTGVGTADIETIIVGSGILSHQKALNAAATPLIKLQATIFGFDTIKPYEVLEFTGDVPSRYKFTTGSTIRYYRPTSLSYDLMNDKVKIKMYGIS